MKEKIYLLIALVMLTFNSAKCQDFDSYTNEMPSVTKVLNDVKGKNYNESKALQCGAFWQLQEIIATFSVARTRTGQLNKEEGNLTAQYGHANEAIFREMQTALSKTEFTQWEKLYQSCKWDANNKESLIKHFFSNNWRSAYENAVKVKTENGVMSQSKYEEMHMTDKQKYERNKDKILTSRLSIIKLIIVLIIVLMIAEIIVNRNIGKLSDVTENSAKIDMPGRTVKINWRTGQVVDAQKRGELKVSGGGGGGGSFQGTGYNAPVSISSETIVHDYISIIDKNNLEHSFHITGLDLACRPGHNISIVYVQNKNTPFPILAQNFSTKTYTYNTTSFRRIFGPSRIILFIYWLSLSAITYILYYEDGSNPLGKAFIALGIGFVANVFLYVFHQRIVGGKRAARFLKRMDFSVLTK